MTLVETALIQPRYGEIFSFTGQRILDFDEGGVNIQSRIAVII